MDAVARGGDLVERAARRDALGTIVHERRAVSRARLVVLLLDEQPLLAVGVPRSSHADERPAAAQLLAEELELQLARAVRLEGIAVGLPRAAVPEDDRAAAVLALRDDPLERSVLDRVVLDVRRE